MLETPPAGSELIEIGPFEVIVPKGNEGDSAAVVTVEPASEAETRAAVARLREVFARWRVAPHVEFEEAAFPRLGRWLEASGLRLEERNPLMACRPSTFAPYTAPDVSVERLSPSSPREALTAFQAIRWTDGGDLRREPPAVARLLADLESPASVYLLATLGGRPAGTAVSHALKGAAEIVGVVTRNDMRRRGVAATLTSALVSRHFASAGDFAFLDAANEEAIRVYERLGFRRFGANVVYG